MLVKFAPLRVDHAFPRLMAEFAGSRERRSHE